MPSITMRTTRVERELGFTATPFDKALARTFAWYQAQPGRPAPDFTFDDLVLESS